MRRLLTIVVLLGLAGAGAFWLLTQPRKVPAADLAGLSGDAARGARVYLAAGCGSCHMAPGATGADRDVLSGGQRFVTGFGTFVAPNISSHPEAGIGRWTVADLANAMRHGVSPAGTHYYPAFPYVSYAGASLQHIADLRAHLATLPADATPSLPHELAFPFTLRRGLGLWKLAFPPATPPAPANLTEAEARGRYLVEALGHCAECHTPRNLAGALDLSRWLAGAPNPSGQGRIPNITPARLDWTEDQIVAYLTSGFTPDFDSAGGHMALVVDNYARLPEADRAAVAAWLKRVAPVD